MTFPPRWDSFSAPRPARTKRRPRLLPLLCLLLLLGATAWALYTAAHPRPLHLIYPPATPTETP